MVQSLPQFSRPVPMAEITPEIVTERLSYRLRRMIGTGRRWSYAGVAALTGIDVRTLKAYVQGTACPNLVRYKRLLAVLGPEIAHELNAMQGWLPRIGAVPPEALDLAELRAELARAVDILRCALDLPRDAALSPATTPPADAPDPEVLDTLPEFRPPLRVEDIDTDAIARRLACRLGQLIGPGRRWQLAAVAAATGIDQRTMQSYVHGEALPNLARYYRLERLFGPELGIELARMLGWEPRHGRPMPIDRASLDALERALDAARTIVDGLLEEGPCLIRRDRPAAGQPASLMAPSIHR